MGCKSSAEHLATSASRLFNTFLRIWPDALRLPSPEQEPKQAVGDIMLSSNPPSFENSPSYFMLLLGGRGML